MIDLCGELVRFQDEEADQYRRLVGALDFDNGIVRNHTLAPIIKEYLTILQESWPQGIGILAFFSDRSLKHPKHLCLGRVFHGRIRSPLKEPDEGYVYLGLRFSPDESPFLRFDTWPRQNSPLKAILPPNHRVTGMPLPQTGSLLLDLAKQFSLNY